jgi:large subunit ribosomal protein L33
MAKKKGLRDYVVLQCSVCGHRNYRTPKQLRGTPKLELKKYCKWCRLHQAHKERKK